MLKSFKIFIPYFTVAATVLGSLGVIFSSPASARTLVTCGPHGASYIVDIVPAGCRVLTAASPPLQAGNTVENSRLGSYFTASTPHQVHWRHAIATAKPIQ